MTWEARFERALHELRVAIARPHEAQTALLQRLMMRAASTRWGELYDAASIRTLGEYQARVPLTGYDGHAAMIQRMAAGEPDVLFPGKARFVAKTSGTSGQPKLVVLPDDVDEEYVALIGTMLAARSGAYPGYLDRSVFLSGRYDEGRNEAGIQFGSASGFVRRLFASVPHFGGVPEEVFEETDHELRYYGLLFYTLSRPLEMLSSLNPSSLLALFDRLQRHGEALCADLEAGRPERAPRWPAIAPAPEVAARLRVALRRSGGLVATAAWPELRALAVWRGGDAQHYVPKLLERCPGVELWPMQHSSSEGGVAVPLAREWVGGVPALTATVLELFPQHGDVTSTESVPIEELREGHAYRVAITNARGFYRYLLDDVSIVEGFDQGVPILQYSHRVGGTSSLTGEKLTPQQVRQAVEGLDELHAIRQFRLAPRWGSPPRYVFFVELERDRRIDAGALRARLDAKLRQLNIEYDAKRESFRLAPLEVAVVAPSYFEELRAQAISGRSDAQYKLLPLSRELAAWPPESLLEHVADGA